MYSNQDFQKNQGQSRARIENLLILVITMLQVTQMLVTKNSSHKMMKAIC